MRHLVVKSALGVAGCRCPNLNPRLIECMLDVALLATALVQVSCFFHCQLVQPGDFSQIVQEFPFAQMQRIEIVGHPHHCLYICSLETRCLMETQCELVPGAFHVVRSQVHLLLRVLMPKMLVSGVPTVLVPGVLVPRFAVPGMLEALVLSRAWEYTRDHLKSWN